MSITRRGFVKGASAAGAAMLTLPLARGTQRSATSATSDASEFTFVHLTDMHVTPRRRGADGYRRCVQSVLDLKSRPAFALMGGDLAFDGLYTSKSDFEEQIRLYKEVSRGLNIPCHNCMGNHDALGWSARRKCAMDDPDLGKKMIMDRLEWPKSYYSFDHAGWHFSVLDSIFPTQAGHGPDYEPRIGPEQLEWLAYDLGAAGNRPKIVVTHIAAFCNIGQWNGDPNAKAMNGNMVLWDTKELRQVLERHKVKAVLQGHSHRIEEYRLNGVWYVTSAAVSGAWWAGEWAGSPPGYTLLGCRGDELTWEHRRFDWTPHLEPEDELERRRIAEADSFAREQRRLLELERGGKKP